MGKKLSWRGSGGPEKEKSDNSGSASSSKDEQKGEQTKKMNWRRRQVKI